MNNLIKKSKNPNYLETVLNNSLDQKLITLDDYEQIVFKLLTLLIANIKHFTGGLTSSVSVDKARNINDSNIWILGRYLERVTDKNALDILIYYDIHKIFKQATDDLVRAVNKTKLFYYSIFLPSLIPIDNYFYNATLKKGIDAFFKIYNYAFDAKNYCITVDYEAYLKRPNLYGIDFISEYLNYIYYENLFCQKFRFSSIHKLLKRIFNNYAELPINIYEYVFTTSLILAYLKKDIYELNFPINYESLYRDYEKNDYDYKIDLQRAYYTLKKQLKPQENLAAYMDRCSQNIINTIIIYTKNKTLDIILGPIRNKKIYYQFNQPMSTKSYKQLLENIKNASDEEKIVLIKENVISLYDLVEILKTDMLSKEEVVNFLETLATGEIMALKKYSESFDYKELDDILSKVILNKPIKEQHIINKNYNFIEIVS